MAIRFQLRRDTTANWANTNPILALGEPGVETDTLRVKIGDGNTAWNSLGYSITKDFADLTNTPTTLAGYGITNAATAAQGTTADSAVQPGDIGTAAAQDTSYFATAAQGTTADSAVQPGDAIETSIIDSADSSAITITPDVVLSAGLTVGNHIVPSSNESIDLGSPTNRFRTLYLAGETLDLGGVEIKKVGNSVELPAGSSIKGQNAIAAPDQGLDTTDSVNFQNITATGYLRGPASFVIDPAAFGDDTGTVVIAGNLQVDGVQTTINSTTVEIDDLNFTIASAAADSAAANGAGITVGGAGATLNYTHATTSWDMNKPLNITGNLGVSGTVDGVDIAARDAILTSTTSTANSAVQPGDIGTAAAQDTSYFATAAQGTLADSALQPDGDGSALTGIVAGLEWSRKIANYTTSNNDAVIADTSGGVWTLTLPASPSLGDLVRVTDGADWSANNLTVARNGSTIEGDAADMTMDIGGGAVDFVYDGTTWQIYAQVGPLAGNSPTFAGLTVDGNVGIGTSSPAVKLAVVGAISATTTINGALNGTVGASTPAAGAFTTLSASGTSTLAAVNASGNVTRTGTGTSGGNNAGGVGVHFGSHAAGQFINFNDTTTASEVVGTIQGWNTTYNTFTSKIEFTKPGGNLGDIRFYTGTATGALALTIGGSGQNATFVGGVGIGGSAAPGSTGLAVTGAISATEIISANKGITFPATQVASANANTLDDYEEGTWTPVINFGGASVGVTYAADGQVGRYTKVGNLVTVSSWISLTSKGSSTGAATVTGLPFPSVNTGGQYTSATYWGVSITFADMVVAYNPPNNSSIVLDGVTNAGVNSALSNADFANTSAFMISISYRSAG